MSWRSNVRITVRQHEFPIDWLTWELMLKNGDWDNYGKIVKEELCHNIITNVGKNMARDLLRDTISDGKIKYVAIGTGSTAPAATQTQLVTEVLRKPVTKFTAGTTGKLVTTVYIAPGEGNVGIQEIGWFAGPAATAVVNSGIMMSRVLYAHSKTNLESLQIDREDTFA
jgi:hypothetical protein